MSFTERRTGFAGNLTEQQAKALEELRKQIQASEFAEDFARDPEEDQLLLKFLRATMKDKGGERIFQAAAAEARLVNSFKWRREYDLETIRENYIRDGTEPERQTYFRSLYPYYDVINEETGQLVRFQRFGRFISVVDVHSLPLREWIQCFAFESFMLQHKLRQLSQKHGREISTYAVVSDMSGLSMASVVKKLAFVKLMSGLSTDNFPETMGRTLLVRGPWIMPSIYNFVKPFIDKDVAAKFVLSTDLCTEEIAKLIPLESIPREFGGASDAVVPNVVVD